MASWGVGAASPFFPEPNNFARRLMAAIYLKSTMLNTIKSKMGVYLLDTGNSLCPCATGQQNS